MSLDKPDKKNSYYIDFDFIAKINSDLGISLDEQFKRNLILFHEEQNCVDAGLDYYQRPAKIHLDALLPWQNLVNAALLDKIELYICSAFRSYVYQSGLIQRKLEKGQKINEVIKTLAPPGFSEHHTGMAIDVITTGMQGVDQSFELTDAFKWLQKYAQDFNFFMSYPRDNPYGYIYEPWHWCYKNPA